MVTIPLCVDCKWFARMDWTRGVCIHAQSFSLDPVYGRADAMEARSTHGKCGPTGKLWEAGDSK